MSIQFENPMDEETQRRLREWFGPQIAAMDERLVLLNRLELESTKMQDLANRTKGPVVVELHDEGEIKTLGDGTRYRVTAAGWKRMDREEGEGP